MILQRQPNKFSCVATSFAMAMGILVEKIFEDLAKDGSVLLDDSQHEGFSPQEMIYYAYTQGYYTITFDTKMELINQKGKIYTREPPYNIYELIKFHQGVLIGEAPPQGKLHSVANDGMTIYDPNGTIYTLTYDNFKIVTFYLIRY